MEKLDTLLALIVIVSTVDVFGLEDDCADPFPVPNAYRRFSGDPNANDTTIQYSCYMGFTLISGNLNRRCTDGLYSGQPPVCKVDCGEARVYEESNRTVSGTIEGSVVHYTCLSDTTITSSAICLPTGRWQYQDEFPCFVPFNIAQNKPFQPNIPLIGFAFDGNLTSVAEMGPGNLISITVDIADNNIFYDLKNYVIRFYDKDEPNIEMIEFCMTGIMVVDGSFININNPCGRTNTEGGVAKNFVLDEAIPCCFAVNQVSIFTNMVNDTQGTFGVDEIEIYGRQRIVDCGNPEFVYGAKVTLWTADNLQYGKYECRDGFYLTSPFNSFYCHPDMYWQFPSSYRTTCSDEPLLPMSTSLAEFTDGDDLTCRSVSANQDVILDTNVWIEVNYVIIRFDGGDVNGIKVTLPAGRKCKAIYDEAGLVNVYYCFYKLAHNITVTNTGPSDVSICEMRVTGRSKPIFRRLECFRLDDMIDYKGEINVTVSGKACRHWSDNVAPQITRLYHYNYCRAFGNESRPWCYVNDQGDWEFCPVRRCDEFCSLRQDGFDYLGNQDFSATGRTCRPWNQADSKGRVFHEMSFPYGENNNNFCRNPGKSQPRPWCYVDGSLDEYETCNIPQCPDGFQERQLVNDSTVVEGVYQVAYFYNTTSEEMVQDYNLTVDVDFVQRYCRNEMTYRIYAFKPTDSWEEIIITCVAEEDLPLTLIVSSSSTSDIEPSTVISPTITSGYEMTSFTLETIQDSSSYFTDSFLDSYESISATRYSSATPFLDLSTSVPWVPDFVTINVSCELSSMLSLTDLVTSVTPMTSVTPITSVTPLSNNSCSCKCFPKKIYNVSQLTLQNKIENISKELTVNTQTLSATIRKLTSAEDPRPSATYVGSAAIFIFSLSFVLIVLPDIIQMIFFFKKCVMTRRRESLIL